MAKEVTLDLDGLTEFQQQFLKARDVSAPIVLIRSADASSTIASAAKYVVNKFDKPAPVIQWDAVKGFVHVNAEGSAVVQQLKACKNAVDALDKLVAPPGLPEYGAVFMLVPEPDKFYRDMTVVQAVWNVRNHFKQNFRMLALIQPTGSVPLALEHDVLIIDEPLPTPADLERVVVTTCRNAKCDPPKGDEMIRATDALSGLSTFAAEQSVALSIRRAGLDLVALRARHRQMINNTKGLTVWNGGETFNDIGGLANFKTFATRLKYKFGAVIWVDEIEKAFGGLRGDLTGITQDYLGVLLGYMTDAKVPGILLMGHPGGGKSLLAKAMGNTAKVPTIRMDLGAMHGSLVGESQHALRHAIKISDRVSQGKPLMIATCNSVAILPPEFVNRFKWRFFVDMPSREEKDAIWPIQLKQHGLPATMPRPDDTEWNGREIEQCCETAVQLGCDLKMAADFVVPIAQSSAELIEIRRREANGRYLSASDKGVFGYTSKEAIQIGNRSIKLRDDDPRWAVPGTDKVN